MKMAMANLAKWSSVGVLAASGVLVFACGGGSSEGGGGATPSATVTTPASQTSQPATSAAASAAPTQTATPAPALVVVAMKLTGPKMKGAIEIKDDGSIVGPEGKVVAKIVGAEMQDKDGKTLVSVAADGTVKFAGAQHGAKFDDKDDLVVDNGAKFQIADDGAVKLVNEDGKLDKDSGKLKLAGFKPSARRAAAVFVLGLLMPTMSSTSTAIASAAPATSGPPAKK